MAPNMDGLWPPLANSEEPVEPDDAGTDHDVPADLVELHEILEWRAAIEEQQQ